MPLKAKADIPVGSTSASSSRVHAKPASRRERVSDSWPLSLTLPLAATVLAVALAGQGFSDYWLSLFTQAGAYSLAVLGVTFFIGRAGQVSFGHNAFVAIGAYATAIGTTRWELSPAVMALFGMVAAAGIATAVGLPTLRLQGHYLALATFALGSGAVALATAADWTGGQTGIQGIAPLGILGLDLASIRDTFYGVWLVTLVGAIIAWRLGQLRFGMALRTLAADEDTARSTGISPLRYKVIAFAVSAAFCALAGSLLAHSTLFINPDSFGFEATLLTIYLAMMIGGMGTVWGSIIGTIVVVTLPLYVPGFQEIRPTLFAVLLLIVLVARPAGLLAPLAPETADRARRLWTKVRPRHSAPKPSSEGASSA